MLVLSRHENESVIINDNIRVMVVEIGINRNGRFKVRLGIQAPKDVPVHRQEVWLAIQRERDADEGGGDA